MKLKTIDLFSGAGGLSLGFISTGCFDIVAAIELDKHAASTYRANHKGVEVLQADASEICFKDEIEDRFGKIDVVIGGPPCQGFSNANRQKASLVSGNNQLVRHYARAVEELKPKAFVLENVKTLGYSTQFFFITGENREEILRLGVKTKKEKIVLCSGDEPARLIKDLMEDLSGINGFRVNENAYSILKKLLTFSRNSKRAETYIKKQLKKITWLLDKWSLHHGSYWSVEWQSFYEGCSKFIEQFALEGSGYDEYYSRLKILVEIERTVERLHELKANDIDFEYKCLEKSVVAIAEVFSISEYLELKFKDLGYVTGKGVLNAADFGVPQNRERFIMIGIDKRLINGGAVVLPSPILNSSNYYSVKDAIEDLETLAPSFYVNAEAMPHEKRELSKLAALLSDTDSIPNHVITDTGEDALKRFKALNQGENFHDLDTSLKESYSLPERTQNTIYLRLVYNQPSGTVMNARKSMWVHPTLDRALSIREAARLQSFPDSFVFHGTKNAQYQQVGNAVPPFLGRAIAESILKQLSIQMMQSSLADDLGCNCEHSRREDEEPASIAL